MKIKVIISLFILLFVIGFMGNAFAQSQDEALRLHQKGWEAYKYGKYNEALTYYEMSLEMNRRLKNPRGISVNLNNIGEVYRALGQYEKALTYHEESLKIRRQLNIPQDIATSLSNIGIVYLSQKRYRDAEKNFIEAKSNPGLVDVYIGTGRHNEALRLLKEMTPEWNSIDPYRIQFHTQHGVALKGSGSFKDASYEFLKAVSITEEMRQKVKGEKSGFLGGGSAGGRIRAYRGLFSTLAERVINEDNNPLSPFVKGELKGVVPLLRN